MNIVERNFSLLLSKSFVTRMIAPTENVFGLGTGIYTIPDVAAILSLPQAKVRRWLHEYWNEQFGKPDQTIFSNGTGKELVTNFLTVMEFFVFYQLREEKISVKKIIEAHEILSIEYNTRYPFAKSKILTDGKGVLFRGESGNIIKADKSKQITIKEVFEPFCKKVEFSDHDLAAKFYPLGKAKSIVIDPKRQFGQPVISNTNVLSETIYNLFRGGESKTVIANLYDLKESQVQDAIDYHRNAA